MYTIYKYIHTFPSALIIRFIIDTITFNGEPEFLVFLRLCVWNVLWFLVCGIILLLTRETGENNGFLEKCSWELCTFFYIFIRHFNFKKWEKLYFFQNFFFSLLCAVYGVWARGACMWGWRDLIWEEWVTMDEWCVVQFACHLLEFFFFLGRGGILGRHVDSPLREQSRRRCTLLLKVFSRRISNSKILYFLSILYIRVLSDSRHSYCKSVFQKFSRIFCLIWILIEKKKRQEINPCGRGEIWATLIFKIWFKKKKINSINRLFEKREERIGLINTKWHVKNGIFRWLTKFSYFVYSPAMWAP